MITSPSLEISSWVLLSTNVLLFIPNFFFNNKKLFLLLNFFPFIQEQQI